MKFNFVKEDNVENRRKKFVINLVFKKEEVSKNEIEHMQEELFNVFQEMPYKTTIDDLKVAIDYFLEQESKKYTYVYLKLVEYEGSFVSSLTLNRNKYIK